MTGVPGRTQTRRRVLYETAAVFWCLLAGIATTAGVARETWLVPRIGELRAHQSGTVLVCVLFLATIAVFVRRTRPSTLEALCIGALWALFAVGFEFSIGRYADGLSWNHLLSDYDLSRGRLLPFVWLTVALGPVAVTWLLGGAGHGDS